MLIKGCQSIRRATMPAAGRPSGSKPSSWERMQLAPAGEESQQLAGRQAVAPMGVPLVAGGVAESAHQGQPAGPQPAVQIFQQLSLQEAEVADDGPRTRRARSPPGAGRPPGIGPPPDASRPDGSPWPEPRAASPGPSGGSRARPGTTAARPLPQPRSSTGPAAGGGSRSMCSSNQGGADHRCLPLGPLAHQSAGSWAQASSSRARPVTGARPPLLQMGRQFGHRLSGPAQHQQGLVTRRQHQGGHGCRPSRRPAGDDWPPPPDAGPGTPPGAGYPAHCPAPRRNCRSVTF